MKKSLIALAALAATGAFAQSSVSIDGIVDVGYRHISADAAASKRNDIVNNNSATSQLNFRGVEDLGGGLKALFRLEADFNPSQSSTTNGATGSQYYAGTLFTGEQFIGLSGNFGSIKLGQPNAAALDMNGVAQPFGTALGGGFSGSFGRMGTKGYGINGFVGSGNRVIRHEKTAKYETPNLSGFSASVEYSFQNDNAPVASTAGSASNQNRYSALGLNYANGPLKVAFSTTQAAAGSNRAAGAVSATSLTTGTINANKLAVGERVTDNYLAANYNFGTFVLYGGYTTTKSNISANEDAKSWNIAASMPFGAFDFKANYLRVDDRTSANADARLIGLGADYFLSKRTAVYARYEALDTNTHVSGTGKLNTLALGVRHGF